MTGAPLRHAFDFWKPCIDACEWEALTRYVRPGEVLSAGINVCRPDGEARAYQVAETTGRFSLFAAVDPIHAVPEDAEVMAEIRDSSGQHCSYVLWFPRDGALLVPFDPDAAIGSLWREEYVPAGKRTVLPQAVLSAYYAVVRPLLPPIVKQRLRQMLVRRDPGSEAFLGWPFDVSLDQLQRFLLRMVLVASGRQELRFAWFWPEGRPWAVVLTHDVETAAGLRNVAGVADLELRRGLRSSFNLVPFDYEIPGSLLRRLRDDGFEVGVHGYKHDGLLFSDWSTFLSRVPAINEVGRMWQASGFRSPATYRNAEWMHLLGFEYDSSVSMSAPFEPQPGGCGSCFPFGLGGLTELPITLPQDHTLFGLLGEAGPDAWLSGLDTIADSNGMALVLTHPDPAPGYIGADGNQTHYIRLLDAVAESGAWVPLPREMARWWRTRGGAGHEEVVTLEAISFGHARLGPSGDLRIIPPRPSPEGAQRTDVAEPIATSR